MRGGVERYQFTWPDKKKSVVLANQPINKTLRLDREKSVGRDGTHGSIDTENIYIEGDNLDALKLLQETYLGKVKLIYIDPPYNTGNDFVYEDDFSQSMDEYLDSSGQNDSDGNRLVANTESNGRFHTDWLNMMYPRLKIAKDLLCEDGAIFISIDDNEQNNLKKICDEIFGANLFVACFPWRKRTAKSDVPFGVSQDYEWILCYAKSNSFKASIEGKARKYYETDDFPGRPWRIHDMTKQTTASERPNSFFTMINPKNGDEYPADPNRTWRITKDTFQKYYDAHEIIFPGDYEFLKITKPVARYFKDRDMAKDGDNFGKVALSTKLPEDIGMSQDGTREIKAIFNNIVFSFPKNTSLLKYLLKATTGTDDIVLDFFSGSATTAHAVMKLNAEDKGSRRCILVQLPEKCYEASEAYRLGYRTICDIGEDRIRIVGKKIKEEHSDANVDIGFRVFKVDSSNMKDVYYKPDGYEQGQIDLFTDNIKEDRTPEDLLFQVMLDLGISLSSKIEESVINDKKVFVVGGEYTALDGSKRTHLIACFDKDITDDTVKAIAEKHPSYAVFRDSCMANDSVATNFEQIFETYSPDTVRKVL